MVCGPLAKIWWSAKDELLIYMGIRGPLQLISRTTSGPRRQTLGITGLAYQQIEIFSLFTDQVGSTDREVREGNKFSPTFFEQLLCVKGNLNNR